MNGVELLAASEMLARLERALAASPADSTELVWIEIGRAEAASGRRRDAAPPTRERSLLARVVERGRVGLHATEAERVREIDDAVRHALGQARIDPPPAAPPRLAEPPSGAGVGEAGEAGEAGDAGEVAPPPAFDPELAGLAAGDAGFLLQQSIDRAGPTGQGGRDESARLAWVEAHVAVVNSRGLRRAAEVTAATLTVRTGRGPGAGRAAGSARTLAGLGVEAIADRARRRRAERTIEAEEAGGGPGEASAPTPVVLAAEAVVPLLDLLARHALSARSFRDGASYLAGRLDEPLFDPALRLRDDGADPAGLPFPFDLFGFAKTPVDLIAGGAARTPAVDAALAAALGRPPTPHAVAGDDSRPSHLFLAPGALTDADLAAVATPTGAGLWIGWLDRVACHDPKGLRFRARARAVRRIESGAPGPALGDLVWEDSLPRLLARVGGLGAESVRLAAGDGVLGGISAPAVAFPAVAGLRPAG